MTCEQIATELAPFMRQMQPNIQALAMSQQQQYEQGREKFEERKKEHELLTPLATAGALDPTGASKRAYVAAAMAQAAKERRENEADANSPLAKQAKAQSERLAAQGQQMQGDARLQRLMQLGQQRGCAKK
jgi:DNA polymerase III alpha subunit